jgi:hypothetical protein
VLLIHQPAGIAQKLVLWYSKPEISVRIRIPAYIEVWRNWLAHRSDTAGVVGSSPTTSTQITCTLEKLVYKDKQVNHKIKG